MRVSDFVFDAELDVELLSADPPEGYKNLVSQETRKEEVGKLEKAIGAQEKQSKQLNADEPRPFSLH